MTFESDFAVLTGNAPFPWQRALFDRLVVADFPSMCDLPTGLGKTSVIAIWLIALAKNSRLPRRLVYVVNRRTVVDQSTNEAEKLLAQLQTPASAHLRRALQGLASLDGEPPLAISTLRGELADNQTWRRDPSRPAVIVGTVDMIGSRLLFSGYGCGFKTKPLHAGFLGHDALVLHDEAHLEPAFQTLLESIAAAQTQEARRIRVMALSATGRAAADFTLSPADETHPTVLQRVAAKKALTLHDVPDKKELAETAARLALQREGAVLVFLSTVENVERCAKSLEKAVGKGKVQVLTGTMRGAERDALTTNDAVFARFQPLKSRKTVAQTGTVFLVCTSAGEVGIDLSADHLVTDLPPFDALAQRLGRVNRYGDGDAQVDVIAEPLKARPQQKTNDDAEDEDDTPPKRRDELDWARHATRDLLMTLPRVGTAYDASPRSLRALDREARLAASTPLPGLLHVDELLFDRWSYTTITGRLPGRPPFDPFLHGEAEWEPARTTLAWRREVAWLEDAHLGTKSLDDFLADYPLRARERLSDRTDRVLKHLEQLAARNDKGQLRAWLIRDGGVVRRNDRCWWLLRELVDEHDAKRNPLLSEATVIISPEAGGLLGGLLDGEAEFDAAAPYDLGPMKTERLVREYREDSDDEREVPTHMRLVRAVRRETDDGAVDWFLYTLARAADDEGSRTAQFPQTLDFHLKRTEFWADVLTTRLGLGQNERAAVVQAARWHDLGKNRRVWQRSIKNLDYPEKVLAKMFAKGGVRLSELGRYRHELGSLHDAMKEASFVGLEADERDLALHLIAAHHGRARPHFPAPESIDPEVDEHEVAAIVKEVPLRFDRLQRRYGRWGLAWLESLVRAADYLASGDEESLS